MKTVENELSNKTSSLDKLQREYTTLNEELNKCRTDLEQSQKSDISNREQVSSNTILKTNLITVYKSYHQDAFKFRKINRTVIFYIISNHTSGFENLRNYKTTLSPQRKLS